MAAKKGGRAAIYARISRDKKDDGATLDTQVDLCRELAEKLGLEIIAEYREQEGTGASEKSKAKTRPQYEAMLDAVRAGEIDVILAYSDDRITRRPVELEALIKLVDQTGLKIHTVRTEHYDLGTTQGITTARILGAVAAGEARTIAERQKVMFRSNALKGKPKLQRQRPFGWEEDGTTLRESEAALIRAAVKKVIAGSSITAIAREWEAAGVLTAAGNTKWEHSTLKKVLLGWRTAGIRTYQREPLFDERGELVHGLWEPIITLDEREQALTRLRAHARIKKRQGSWPLSGLLRCGECAGSLYGQVPSGRRNRATYACKQGHTAISAGLLEQLVIKELAGRLLEKSEREQEAAPKPRSAEEWPQHKRLSAVREKIAELMEAYRKGTLPASVVFAQVDLLSEEQKQLESDLAEFLVVEAPPVAPIRKPAEAYEWLMELRGPFMREAPKPAKAWENQPWGIPLDEPGEESMTATPQQVEELNQTLKSELESIIIRKGVRGRNQLSEEAFAERVDFLWR